MLIGGHEVSDALGFALEDVLGKLKEERSPRLPELIGCANDSVRVPSQATINYVRFMGWGSDRTFRLDADIAWIIKHWARRNAHS
jgi:hypothetical protein